LANSAQFKSRASLVWGIAEKLGPLSPPLSTPPTCEIDTRACRTMQYAWVSLQLAAAFWQNKWTLLFNARTWALAANRPTTYSAPWLLGITIYDCRL